MGLWVILLLFFMGFMSSFEILRLFIGEKGRLFHLNPHYNVEIDIFFFDETFNVTLKPQYSVDISVLI